MISVTYEVELGYQLFSGGAYLTRKPMVALRISAGQNHIDTAAVVDSGAEYSVFDAEVAEAISLNVTGGRQIRLIGLDGSQHIGYLHSVAIRLLAAPQAWPTIRGEVIFRENHPKDLGNLLGRRDFFRALRIGFDEEKQNLYLGQA